MGALTRLYVFLEEGGCVCDTLPGTQHLIPQVIRVIDCHDKAIFSMYEINRDVIIAVSALMRMLSSTHDIIGT